MNKEKRFSKFLEKRKLEIVSAVLKLADKFGIKGITTKRIAEEVGFNEGALYKHIKSKADIYEIILDVSSKLINNKFDELNRKKSPEDEKLKEWFLFSIDYLEDFPGIYRIVFSDELYVDNRELFLKFKDITFSIKDRVEKIITDGIKNRIFKSSLSPEKTAILYLGVIHTSFTLWNIFERKEGNLKEISIEIFNEYMKMIKKEV